MNTAATHLPASATASLVSAVDASRLSPVAKTMMIPLWARAMEARRARPMLVDQRAAEIHERLAFDFSFLHRAYGTRLGCVIRTLLFDRWVSDFLVRHPHGTVVELGAGLSTRFERVDNGTVTWIDVDLPDAMELRRAHIEPSHRRTFVAGSVVDREWIEHVRRLGRRPVYVVCEGMLMYLAPQDVRDLLARIADTFAPCEVALDSISPAVVRHQGLHDSMRHIMDAPFLWGVEDIHEIEGWDRRIRVRDVATLPQITQRFADRVARRHQLCARVIASMIPALAESYRLSRVSLARDQE